MFDYVRTVMGESNGKGEKRETQGRKSGEGQLKLGTFERTYAT